MSPAPQPIISRHVAVIGAGASGLVTARELRREGHSVVVFERGDQVGGTWVYNPKTESDPMGLNPERNTIHSSLYRSLRTNLPRECMGFSDYPFVAKDDPDRDPRRFSSHREVLMYLQDFTREFEIDELVRFETEIVRVRLVESLKWEIKSKTSGKDETIGHVVDEIFDAVVVCSGHYTQPRIAQIPGINEWPGKQMHSHNYRVPDPFRDQVVVLIGSSESAFDISLEVARVAKEVHIAARTVADETFGKQPVYDNMWLHPMIESVREDGTVFFQDGSFVLPDIILHCTGYEYHFPFLETNGIVTVDDNRVGPLYKHIFPPALAPWLSFVGLAWKAIPFPLCELQSKWIAGVLSNRFTLPSQEEMMEDVEAFYSSLEASGTPKRYTHCMGANLVVYTNWLQGQCGCPANEEWRIQMCLATFKSRLARPESYRDEWEDQQLILQAHEDFIKLTSNQVSDRCTSQ
ncbi:flavin-containing monooxygenase FMO GS-OX-like 4 isoform X1 [Fagus crenata]